MSLGSYGRLDPDGLFRTAMTTVRPNSKESVVLHPTQKRVLTVREVARAQGFPDTYEFASVCVQRRGIIEDQYRQIGNAVPVTLALALAKAFGKTVIEQDREAGGELDDHDENQNDVDGSDASEEY